MMKRVTSRIWSSRSGPPKRSLNVGCVTSHMLLVLTGRPAAVTLSM
ncbi:MAG: hypothetical protein KatS3mg052_1562 [Candidatus Roseilinea sp.]|nr:MAG: hypothetical protein KatS3mg052_1562 [Candidatus Roseilinea sp.]